MVSLMVPSSIWVHCLSSNSQQVELPLFYGVVEILFEVFVNGRRSDKSLDFFSKKNKKWGSRDRRWIAEQVYFCVRNWRKLVESSGWGPWSDSYLPAFGQTDRWDKDEVTYFVGCALAIQGYDLNRIQNNFKLPDGFEKSWKSGRAHMECSDFFSEIGTSQLQDRWPAVIAAMNESARPYLRVNALKEISREELAQALVAEGYDVSEVSGVETALQLNQRKNVFQSAWFLKGCFEMQDAASQKIAPLLEIQPGQRVVDACAGAGGKTLHMASLMKNKGQIIALDIYQWKLDELRTRAARAGAHNIETRCIEGSKTLKRLNQTADRLLLDVPCTGSGVLRRNPDPKWRLQPNEWESLKQTQKEILWQYPKILKLGGLMVYATCSVFPEENENQVAAFLEAHPGEFTLKQEFHNWPNENPFDGFYAAVLQKNSKG